MATLTAGLAVGPLVTPADRLPGGPSAAAALVVQGRQDVVPAGAADPEI